MHFHTTSRHRATMLGIALVTSGALLLTGCGRGGDSGGGDAGASTTVDDEPAAFDVPLLVAQLGELRRGKPIRKPVYCAEERVRTGVEVVAPARLVLVEGRFTLWWDALRSLLDVKVFVDAPAELRLLRRIRRDRGDRDRSGSRRGCGSSPR